MWNRILKLLHGAGGSGGAHRRQCPGRARPGVESLDARDLPSAGVIPHTSASGRAVHFVAKDFDSGDFVSKIDNPFFPLVPGTTFIYQGIKDGQVSRDEFSVTHQTKTILGVRTTVIRDRAFLDGRLVEDTIDWFAQDEDGNVWYFGENSKTLENGVVVSTEGSWQAGVKGARPGIIMEAHPRPGDSYHQEFAPGVAEDQAQVLSLHDNVTVPFGSFRDVLKTRDFSRLDPAGTEIKQYAPGIGFIRSRDLHGGMEFLELVSIQRRR